MVGLVVAAPSSGSGKTVATLALLAALANRGIPVQPAKVGPDYIDTAYLTAAAGRAAVNLDLWAMRPALFDALAATDHLVVEGVMGLFDGPSHGAGSTADVARRLSLPVLLVVDASGFSHSVAALVHGFATFDPAIDVAGVLLTRVASARHETMLRAALAPTGRPVLGALPRDPRLTLASRHLGLVQASEQPALSRLVADAAALLEANADVAAIAALGSAAPREAHTATIALPPPGSRIAIASDAAFSFTYAHIKAGWRAAGATLVPFSPLAGEGPDTAADAVVLPGGYPELFAGHLAAQRAWKDGLAAAAARGALIYGECGGYMALGETLVDADGTGHAMAGLLPVTTSMDGARRTLGYRRLEHDGALWPAALRGHEFHYAHETERRAVPPLFKAFASDGTALGPTGARIGRTAGSFAHLIDRADPPPLARHP